VADKLQPGHRAACFGLILASFSMGILIGPPIGGLLQPIVASYTAMSCVGGALLYVIFILDESLSERSKAEVTCFLSHGPVLYYIISSFLSKQKPL